MEKVRLTLCVQARPYTEDEAQEEAKLTGLPVEDLIDHEIDAHGIGECIAGYLDGGCEEALAGSNMMVHLGTVTLEDAELSEESLSERVAQMMSETAPTWGWRIHRLLAMLGLDFGTAEETDWSLLRDAHRQIRHDPEAMDAARRLQDWPPMRGPTKCQTEHFRIVLPSNEGIGTVRKEADGKFTVWVEDPSHHGGGYRSAWNFDTFEAAVRNLMDVLWPSCLPFESN